MNKSFSANWAARDDAVLELVPWSSRGLIGEDRRRFEKRATAVFLRLLDGVNPRPGEVLAHGIALGCTEAFGPNRNADGFEKAACVAYHHTFVKHAKIYRNHANRRTSPYYGRVVKSAFNDQMGRIELILGFNGTKEACAANGGFVADRELQKLASKRDIALSMSCRIAHDYCSHCNHKAASRDEYCLPDTCSRGGLRKNAGRLYDDGHILHARNPTPCFFDITHVESDRPADRIAYTSGVIKSASENWRQPQPMGIRNVLSTDEVAIYDRLLVLSDLEKEGICGWQRPATPRFHVPLADTDFLKSATAQGVLLTPCEFAIAIGLPPVEAEKLAAAASPVLRNAFSLAVSDPDADSLLAGADLREKVASLTSRELSSWSLRSGFSNVVSREAVRSATETSAPRLSLIADRPLEKFAAAYGIYQAAFALATDNILKNPRIDRFLVSSNRLS